MKQLIIKAISFYQTFISPLLKQALGVSSMCRFSPSCSQYAKISIKKYGVIKGGSLAFKRLLSCQPFSSQKITNSKLQISNKF